MQPEPFEVSFRFRSAVVSAIFRLEHNAAQDEQTLPGLANEGHQRRQRLLIEKQLDRAFRLREMLALLEAPNSKIRLEKSDGTQ